MEKKEFKLRWPSDSGPAVYVNNMTIQAEVSGVFYITFFQALPPIIVGTEEDQKEQLRNTDYINAQPMIKLAITRDKLESFLEILQRQLSNTNEHNNT